MHDRVADEDDRPCRRVDLLSVDGERRVPVDDDVELLVRDRRVLVLPDQNVLGAGRRPGVDAEGRLPAMLKYDERNVADTDAATCASRTKRLESSNVIA